ncbi:hypothetical protein DFH08DRAFT_668381, partial [Mycena albidolilacea]
SIYTTLIGFGAENIVSARLVTAAGELAARAPHHRTSHPELLWGLCGAGQFLGLVTALT